jgi:hypothetical protein
MKRLAAHNRFMGATAVGMRSLARASLRLLIAISDSGVPGSGLGQPSCQQEGRWGHLSSKHVSKMAFS